jgi:hypothetical protein
MALKGVWPKVRDMGLPVKGSGGFGGLAGCFVGLGDIGGVRLAVQSGMTTNLTTKVNMFHLVE